MSRRATVRRPFLTAGGIPVHSSGYVAQARRLAALPGGDGVGALERDAPAQEVSPLFLPTESNNCLGRGEQMWS